MSKKFKLIDNYTPKGSQPQAIDELVEGLNDGLMHQTLLGVTGSGKTFTVANIINICQRPAIILAPNKTLAAQLYGEMREFFPENAVEYFVSYYDYYQPEAYVPTSDTYIEKDASINEHIERMRLSATKAILERTDTIIVATVSAIYGLGSPEHYLSMILHLDRGEVISQRDILRRLTEIQYERNDIDFRRGTYRVRGDVIDIFPAAEESLGLRVELFGDEIEELTLFDPLTQEKIHKVPRFTVHPKTHYVTPRAQILQAMDLIKAELGERLAQLEGNHKLLEAQRLRERTTYDLEMMQELGYCSGIENYSRYLAGKEAGAPPATLINYLPPNALMFIDESHVTVPQLGAMYKGDRARKENLVEYGFRLPSALDNRPLKFAEFETNQPQTIYVSATPSKHEHEFSDKIVEQIIRPTGLIDPIIEIRPATNQVDDVYGEIKQRTKNKERVLITTLTKKMAEDLTDYLANMQIKVRYLHSDIDTVERVEIIRDLRLGVFDVLIGINLLREGLDMPEVSLVAILDADKEGFLRSDKSLIQTIGRAARNLNGMAILYADKITGSMQRAIDETERRRAIQIEYNLQHNIIPQTINKKITDILEGARLAKNSNKNKDKTSPEVDYTTMPAASLLKLLANVENNMHKHAQNLEFEEASKLRDQARIIRQYL